MKTLHEKLQDLIVQNSEKLNDSLENNSVSSSTDSQDIIIQEQEHISQMFSKLQKMLKKTNQALQMFNKRYTQYEDDMQYFLSHNINYRKFEKSLNEFLEMMQNLQNPNSKNENLLRKSIQTNLYQSTSTSETDFHKQYRTLSQPNIVQIFNKDQLQKFTTEPQKLQNSNSFQQIQECLRENLELKKLLAEQKNKLFQFWRIVFKYQSFQDNNFTNFEECQKRISKSFELNIFYSELLEKIKEIFLKIRNVINQNTSKDSRKNNWRTFFEEFHQFFVSVEDKILQDCIIALKEDFLFNYQESIAQSFFTFKN